MAPLPRGAEVPAKESALIGLGSNLGDRAGFLRRAVERLAASEGVEWLRLSTIRETAPEGDPVQGDLGGPYLNAAGEIRTALSPRGLLELCLSVEAELGRDRPRRNAPRPIDLDILLFGDRVAEDPDLVLPHPRMLERRFVLEPLAEIAPRRRHPVTGRTLLEHWQEWRSRHARDR